MITTARSKNGYTTPKPQRNVVLSIQPQYSQKIMEGRKTVELRRRFPASIPEGTIAYIYSTSPVRTMVGSTEITAVIKRPVSEIWKFYKEQAFIKQTDFDAYFAGREEGFVLTLANVKPLSSPLNLAELRERFGFEPPQSFLYAKPNLQRALQDEYSGISH